MEDNITSSEESEIESDTETKTARYCMYVLLSVYHIWVGHAGREALIVV